ncbi:MAG: type IX secretion system membrane protein PorP/SprF [Bacteroidia bacterium]
MLKRFLLLSLIVLSSFYKEGGIACAQQIAMYSHYFYNPFLYNPAFAGSFGATNAMVLHRNQWADFKGAPRLTFFTMDGVMDDEKTGLGFGIINDRKGLSNSTSGNVSYAYNVRLSNDARLALGAALSVTYQTLDFSQTLVENNTDPNLITDVQRKTALDGNAGLGFFWKDLTVGLAIPQVVANKINYVDYNNVRLYYSNARHYMASVKYKFMISQSKEIAITPLALLRLVAGAPLQYDGNINIDWKNKFWIGATFKSNYAVAANVGFSLHKQLSLGYSYDYIIGSIGNYSGLSHELMLCFKFSDNKKPEKVDSAAIRAAELNKNYAELLSKIQTDIDSTDKSIKELENRIASENSLLDKNITLNDLLVNQLLKRIEAMFDSEKPAEEEIQSLRNEVAAFLDSDLSDNSSKKQLKKQYQQLNRSQGTSSVLVKGTVILPKNITETNYSSVKITVTDKETSGIVGTYIPNAKTGKYLFILTPGRDYIVTAESQGYDQYSENFSPASSKESYEMTHEIRMLEKNK